MKKLIRIAILSTGDEILLGELINTNSQYLGEQLTKHHYVAGMQITASDDQTEIANAIQFLLQTHGALITMGGLGPTSDDRTRYALAQACDIELKPNQDVFKRLENLYAKKNIEFRENSKQQALFPVHADIYTNNNGSADACRFVFNEKPIYMLPGPPDEMKPIFHEHVLPDLKHFDLEQKIFRKNWILHNVAESHVASQLDPLVDSNECYLGFRFHRIDGKKSTVEIKLSSTNKDHLKKYIAILQPVIEKISP